MTSSSMLGRVTLMMEVLRSSETSVLTGATLLKMLTKIFVKGSVSRFRNFHINFYKFYVSFSTRLLQLTLGHHKLCANLCNIGSENIVTFSTEGSRCYATLLWLPSNRGRMVSWIRPPLLYCCVHVGCIAINSGKASVGCYGTQQ
jgi:hypothetical protein